MDIAVQVGVIAALVLAFASIAGGVVLFRGSRQVGWRALGMSGVAGGIGVFVVFALLLTVSSEGEAPEPVVIGQVVTTEPTDAPTTSQEPSSPTSSGMMVPRPRSVDELVMRSDVIVVGLVTAVIEEMRIGGYGDDGMALPGGDGGIPVTDYEIQVESVLNGDDEVAGGDTLVLRMFGHLSDRDSIITPNLFTLPNPGDRLLFALGENPDGTYGSGPEGLLEVGGGNVVYADGVPFAIEVSPERFVQQIKDAVTDRTDRSSLAASDPLSMPEATAPMGLGDVELPEDADSIVSLFNRLPRELAGRERTPRPDETGPSRFTAAYEQLPEDGCSSVRIQADELPFGGFFPADWTADRYVAWFGRGPGDVKDLGRDRDLFWVRRDTTCRSAPSPRATQSEPSPQSYPVRTVTTELSSVDSDLGESRQPLGVLDRGR